jgi:phage head maturation protease
MSDFIHRLVPLEAEITRGDGRTVEAYAAVFDVPAEIRDHQGHYQEVIDRDAFTRVINRAKPQNGRDYWLTKVFYNHGMTLHGTPSESGSVPVGTTQHIEADSKGLLTVTRYGEDTFSQRILSAIKDKSITAQSFTGQIVRSNPNLSPGARHRPVRGGDLPVVRRLELGLTEYGPTPIPAYAGAEMVGVRSLYKLFPTAPGESEEDVVEDSEGNEDAASDEALVARADSPDAKPERSARQDQFQLALMAKLRARGITS